MSCNTEKLDVHFCSFSQWRNCKPRRSLLVCFTSLREGQCDQSVVLLGLCGPSEASASSLCSGIFTMVSCLWIIAGGSCEGEGSQELCMLPSWWHHSSNFANNKLIQALNLSAYSGLTGKKLSLLDRQVNLVTGRVSPYYTFKKSRVKLLQVGNHFSHRIFVWVFT